MRIGYSTYLTFLLGVANTLVILYYLLIQNVTGLEAIFRHFGIFVVISVVVGVPLAVGVGWLHLKQTTALLSEIDIGVEANPYYYKLTPGHQIEVFAPINLELLRQIEVSCYMSAGYLWGTDTSDSLEALGKEFVPVLCPCTVPSKVT